MRVIGLISGTSIDGIDAALVDITGTPDRPQVNLIAGHTYPYPSVLRDRILKVCAGASLEMAELADLDDAIAVEFAQAAIALQTGHAPATLIGSHGQTVFHRPPERNGHWQGDRAGSTTPDPLLNPRSLGYTLQLGRGALIAHLTQISTVSNFRAADIAAGGHGAPLVPAIDQVLLRDPTCDRAVQNIGGIGNVAYLPAENNPAQAAIGWDTGPGNVLLDLAVQQLSNGEKTYDRNGEWAASGTPCQPLVDRWLEHPYFQAPPPKSTGRELFGPTYLQQCLAETSEFALSPADILATLTELTAASIAHSYRTFLPRLPDQVLLCGGGSQNLYLKQRIQARLEAVPVLTTDDVGLDAEFKEAIAFAVLGYWRWHGIPSNLPKVTGAAAAISLGEIHLQGNSPR